MTDYLPGSFFLSSISGPSGWAIGLAQALCGAPSRYEHAGIVLDADGTVLEAEPGGARIANLSEYDGRPLLISDAPVQTWMADKANASGPGLPRKIDEEFIRHEVTQQARKLVGVGYSGLDYLALAALHLHLPSRWIRRRVESSGKAMCSQLVDLCYQRAGIHLFSDGRLPGDVMPADLAAWAEDAQVAR